MPLEKYEQDVCNLVTFFAPDTNSEERNAAMKACTIIPNVLLGFALPVVIALCANLYYRLNAEEWFSSIGIGLAGGLLTGIAEARKQGKGLI